MFRWCFTNHISRGWIDQAASDQRLGTSCLIFVHPEDACRGPNMPYIKSSIYTQTKNKPRMLYLGLDPSGVYLTGLLFRKQLKSF